MYLQAQVGGNQPPALNLKKKKKKLKEKKMDKFEKFWIFGVFDIPFALFCARVVRV